jgi:tryptophan-rich sensory protein
VSTILLWPLALAFAIVQFVIQVCAVLVALLIWERRKAKVDRR